MNETIEHIPLERIEPYEGNRRFGGFDDAKLAQLAESIRAVGVQQPAVVRQVAEGRYELVAGERRWRASRLAGKPTLPCVVRELDDVAAQKVRAIENVHREDMHSLDQSNDLHRLVDEGGYSVASLAGELGMSESWVYKRLKLRDLIEPARTMLIQGAMSAEIAMSLARLPAPQQAVYARQLRDRAEGSGGMTVREFDALLARTAYVDLALATFAVDDGELVPSAGPCSQCPKRNRAQSALFEELGERDYCLDYTCFEAKLDTMVARHERELAAQGVRALEVASKRSRYHDRRKLATGVLEEWEWEECAEGDTDAERTLVVAGPDRGRLTWGKHLRGRTVEGKTHEASERRVARLEVARRTTMMAAIEEELTAQVNRDGRLPLEFLREVAVWAFGHVVLVSREALAMRHGVERPPHGGEKGRPRPSAGAMFERRIRALDAVSVSVLLVECVVADELAEGIPPSKSWLELRAAVRLLGMDPDSLGRTRKRKAKGEQMKSLAREEATGPRLAFGEMEGGRE